MISKRRFLQADMATTFDFDRQKAGKHLAFGSGIHHCIGAPLARQELNLGFRELLNRMYNIRLSPEQKKPVSEPSLLFRALPHLEINFDRPE